MTRYAVGDIHGGAKTFSALLERLTLQHGDRLYLLGDYIDRGPDSRGVLDIILQLQESGYDVRPVRGNHDDMLLQTVNGYHDDYSWCWMKGWGTETLKSFGVTNPEELPDRYLQLLEQMPYVWVEKELVFVHAGLNMDTADPLKDSSPLSMTWEGTEYVDSEKLGGRKLVTGHNARPLPEIEMSLKSNHIMLDNGAFNYTQPGYGNLVALNLETMKMILQPWLDG
jgi:serine/threonine protein phosphatase 1